jgi:hypothetical protein
VSDINYEIGGPAVTRTPNVLYAWFKSDYDDCLLELVLIERWADCDTSTSAHANGHNCNGKSYITHFDQDTGEFTVDTSDYSLDSLTLDMALVIRPVGSGQTDCTSYTFSHPYSNCIKFKISFDEDPPSPCANAVLFPATTA